MTTMPNRPLQPGDPAPSFVLPAVNREGMVSLDDFRGRSPVLLALMRGLHCPFCRRHIAQLGVTRDKLAAEGVETMAVVNTPAERARMYFQYRPTRVVLAADPDVRTHQAYGLPKVGLVPEDTAPSELQWPQRVKMSQVLAMRLNPRGLLPEPMNPFAANEALNRQENFQPTEVDQQVAEAHGTQLTGVFLIDRTGTIVWTYAEGLVPDQVQILPSEAEILAAVRELRP